MVSCGLTGTIPPELGFFTSAAQLCVPCALFARSISAADGHARSGLINNSLTGTLPAELVGLQGDGFSVSRNQLTGSVPDIFAHMGVYAGMCAARLMIA